MLGSRSPAGRASFLGDWMVTPEGSCELKEAQKGVPAPAPHLGRVFLFVLAIQI